MVQSFAKLRTALAALFVLASCLLAVPAAEAGTSHGRAHQRNGCVCRRIVSPKQAFKRIATKRPDRLVRRHVTSVIRSARVTRHQTNDEAAIQTLSTVTVEVDSHASPALQQVGILAPEHVELRTLDGLARRCPRGPPALS